MKPLTVLFITIVLSACCSSSQVIKRKPPAAFLQLADEPEIPAADATNLDLVNYLYKLADDSRFCRSQIDRIKKWTEER